MKVPLPILLAALLGLGLACGAPPAPTSVSAPTKSPSAPTKSPSVPTQRLPAPEPLPIAPLQGGRVPQTDRTRDTATGYRPTPADYGEPDWDHVRLVAIRHLAIVGRDLARMSASRGGWRECAKRYVEAADSASAVPLSGEAVLPIRDVLVAGLRRDAALCEALAAGKPPPATTGLASFRTRYFALAQRAEHGEDVREEARGLIRGLDSAAETTLRDTAPPASAAPATQALWLVRQWDDTVDPLVVTDPWGAWTTAERPRQVKGLRIATDALLAGESTGLYLRPAESLKPQGVDWSRSEFTTTAVNDAWADLGGFAMPHVVPRLDETQPEAEDRAVRLEPLLERWPTTREGELPRAVAGAIEKYAGLPEGLRYYYTLSVQNGAIRQLARQGHYLLAAEIVVRQSPLKGMDWFAPDRAAVLLGLEGRLRVLAADKDAEARLRAAIAESKAFLAFVASRDDSL